MTIETEDIVRIGKHALAGAAAALLLAIWIPVVGLLAAEIVVVGGYTAYKHAKNNEKGKEEGVVHDAE